MNEARGLHPAGGGFPGRHCYLPLRLQRGKAAQRVTGGKRRSGSSGVSGGKGRLRKSGTASVSATSAARSENAEDSRPGSVEIRPQACRVGGVGGGDFFDLRSTGGC